MFFLLLSFGTCTIRTSPGRRDSKITKQRWRGGGGGGGSANATKSTQPEEEEEEEGGKERKKKGKHKP